MEISCGSIDHIAFFRADWTPLPMDSLYVLFFFSLNNVASYRLSMIILGYWQVLIVSRHNHCYRKKKNIYVICKSWKLSFRTGRYQFISRRRYRSIIHRKDTNELEVIRRVYCLYANSFFAMEITSLVTFLAAILTMSEGMCYFCQLFLH